MCGTNQTSDGTDWTVTMIGYLYRLSIGKLYAVDA